MNMKQLLVVVSALLGLGALAWWVRGGGEPSPERIEAEAANRAQPEGPADEVPAAAPEPPSGLVLRALDAEGRAMANRQIVAALEVEGAGRPVAQFAARSDAAGFVTFAWSEPWGRADLRGVHFTQLGHSERLAAGPPPAARPGPQAFVELAPLAADAPVQLGEQRLLRPSRRFPEPLLDGRALSDGGGPLESLWGAARVPRDGAPAPVRGGLELVLLGEGEFAVHGPVELGRVGLEFAARNHVRLERAVDLPAGELELELQRLQRIEGRLLVPAGLDPRACSVAMESEAEAIRLAVAPDGRFDGEGVPGAFRLAVSQTAQGWELWSQTFESLEAYGAGQAVRTIDLRDAVRVVRVRALDGTGAALALAGLDARLDGRDVAALSADGDGRLGIAVPVGAQRLELRRDSAAPWAAVPLDAGGAADVTLP